MNQSDGLTDLLALSDSAQNYKTPERSVRLRPLPSISLLSDLHRQFDIKTRVRPIPRHYLPDGCTTSSGVLACDKSLNKRQVDMVELAAAQLLLKG
jgi:hypothetical protein